MFVLSVNSHSEQTFYLLLYGSSWYRTDKDIEKAFIKP